MPETRGIFVAPHLGLQAACIPRGLGGSCLSPKVSFIAVKRTEREMCRCHRLQVRGSAT